MAGPSTVDPMRGGLVWELRTFRRGRGHDEARLAQLPWLTDCLGQGILERAVARFAHWRDQYGSDPTEAIGAFFWIADRSSDADLSLEMRTKQYGQTFSCDARTALRRSDAGIESLAAIARDFSETSRPVGMFWLFQGAQATVVIDFWLDRESFRVPVVAVNGEAVDTPDFTLHRSDEQVWGDRYRHRMILDNLPLSLDHDPYENALTVRATWEMPIWPVWTITGSSRLAVALVPAGCAPT